MEDDDPDFYRDSDPIELSENYLRVVENAPTNQLSNLGLTSGPLMDGQEISQEDLEYLKRAGNGQAFMDPNEGVQRVKEGDCTYNGKTYGHRMVFKPDKCNVCICMDGIAWCESIQCAELSCPYTFIPDHECCPVCSEDQGQAAERDPIDVMRPRDHNALCPVKSDMSDVESPIYEILKMFNFTAADENSRPIGVELISDDNLGINGFKVTSIADLQAQTKNILPGYLPKEFGVSMNVRLPSEISTKRNFNLFQIDESHLTPMHGLKFVGSRKRLELFSKSLFDPNKVVSIPLTGTEELFDQQWHQVGLAIQKILSKSTLIAKEFLRSKFQKNWTGAPMNLMRIFRLGKGASILKACRQLDLKSSIFKFIAIIVKLLVYSALIYRVRLRIQMSLCL